MYIDAIFSYLILDYAIPLRILIEERLVLVALSLLIRYEIFRT